MSHKRFVDHQYLGRFFPSYVVEGLQQQKNTQQKPPSSHQCRVKVDAPETLDDVRSVREMIRKEYVTTILWKIDRRKNTGHTVLTHKIERVFQSYIPETIEILQQSGYHVIHDPDTTTLLIIWKKETHHE